MTSRVRRQDGAAAVEFALVMPILLLLVMGTIDFARAYNAHISLSGGAREGARVLALTSDPVQAESATKNAAPSIPPGDITVTTSSCLNPGDPARVDASYDFSYITPISGLVSLFGGSALASPVTLNGIGVMRCGG